MSASTAERLSLLTDGRNARLLTVGEVEEINALRAADGLAPMTGALYGLPDAVFRRPPVEGHHVTDLRSFDYQLDLAGCPIYIVGGLPFDSHGWQLCHRCHKLAGSPFCYGVCGELSLDRQLVEAFNRRLAARGGEW